MQSSYPKINGTYKLHKSDIEFESELILRKYDETLLLKPQPTPIELIIESEGLDLIYKSLSDDLSILGAMVFNDGVLNVYEEGKIKLKEFKNKTIIIDSKLVDNNDKRLMFTYAHELGHYVTQFELEHEDENQLSLDLFNQEDKMIASICKRETVKENLMYPGKKELITKVDWQEWQANYFAGCILLPRTTLDIYLEPYHKNYDVMSAEPLLGRLSKSELSRLIDDISNIYDVSHEMTYNRLKSIGYIEGSDLY